GEAGTGDIVEAVRHMRAVKDEIRRLQNLSEDEIYTAAKNLAAPVELMKSVRDQGRLPVVNFAAGGIATPADAALMMRLGADGVFVGSGIFKSENPPAVASAIVQATTHYQDDELLAQVSRGLGAAMRGLAVASLPEEEVLAKRGW
ncbi:MAG TPA: pyridoxal 5'-phosphate synthase lyase subunit PdxS, partial [Dehalococcoidia bacterium]|nr:pyridoxal 5'-phosphate synthase lyase subunit PdxS [Dehalococcoidia bacterium]